MPDLRILFYLAKPYSIPVARPLIELVNNREDCESLCLTPKHLNQFFTNEPVTSVLAEAAAFNPDVVLCPGNYVHDSISGIKVQIFHGLCYEKKSHFRIRDFFQVYCTPGPLITENFQRLAARHKSFIVIETGWPKIDLLFRKVNRPKELEALSSDKKIILYAPTFSRKLTSVPKIIKCIRNIPRENELFVIKLHDLHKKEERNYLKSLPPEKFLVVESPDIIPWIQISDMLISDTSSVVYEYALLKERILLIEPKRKDLPFVQCSASNFRASIDIVLSDRAQRSNSIKQMMDRIHPYRDGLCAQRILDRVVNPEFIEQARNLPVKRNLFRRFKLRYYDKFKKGYIK